MTAGRRAPILCSVPHLTTCLRVLPGAQRFIVLCRRTQAMECWTPGGTLTWTEQRQRAPFHSLRRHPTLQPVVRNWRQQETAVRQQVLSANAPQGCSRSKDTGLTAKFGVRCHVDTDVSYAEVQQRLIRVLYMNADDANGSTHSRASDAAAAPGGRDASAFTAPAASLSGGAAHAGANSLSAEPCRLRLALRLQRVGAIEAAVGLGVERCAASAWQTANWSFSSLKRSLSCIIYSMQYSSQL